jgi:hypothetical protein
MNLCGLQIVIVCLHKALSAAELSSLEVFSVRGDGAMTVTLRTKPHLGAGVCSQAVSAIGYDLLLFQVLNQFVTKFVLIFQSCALPYLLMSLFLIRPLGVGRR